MWIGQTVALVASRVVAPRPRDRIELLDLVRAAKAFGLKVSVLPRMLDVAGS
ncbi:MAG TPA: hypothetical protein VKB54_21765 [Solirubrobacteraceae bacterium]|nr:hypothetical protein [Solirubrobacteraceae bacterium]